MTPKKVKGGHCFDIPLYGGKILVTTDRESLTDRFIEDDLSSYYGITLYPRSTYMVAIGIFDGTINTIAHECAHAALTICEHNGIGNILKEQEAFCHLLGYIHEMTAKCVKLQRDEINE